MLTFCSPREKEELVDVIGLFFLCNMTPAITFLLLTDLLQVVLY